MKYEDYSIDGMKFAVRPESTDVDIIDEVITRDAYRVSDYIKNGMKVIDIGAHIGSFSVYASKLGADVLSFEPMQENFYLLEVNAMRNSSSVLARNVGIWNEAGTQTLHIRQRNFGGTGFFTEGNLTEDIQVIKLDHIFETRDIQCDFLKLDCEDSELLILQAFHYMDRVKRGAVEYVGVERREALIDLIKSDYIYEVVGNDVFGIIHFMRKDI